MNGRRIPVAVWALAVLMPFAVLAWLVERHGIRFPLGDEWEMVPLVRSMRAGSLSFGDVWAQHNEHRILFPNIVMLVMARFSRWNIAWELRASLAFAMASFIGLVVLIRQTFGSRQQRTALAFVFLGGWFFFSPVQSENWLWGFQLEWFMSMCGVILALVFLNPKSEMSWPRLGAGIASGAVACYSLGDGQLIWAVGVVVLVLGRRPKSRLAVWSAIGGLLWALYYWSYSAAGQLPDDGFTHPVRLLRYVLTYLGASLVRNPRGAEVMGASFVVVFVGCTGRLLWSEQGRAVAAPWIGLGCYVGATAVITGVSRLSLGEDQALSSRYTTISSLFVIATVVLGALVIIRYSPPIWEGRRLIAEISLAALVLTLVLAARAYGDGIQEMRALDAGLAGTRTCLQDAPPGGMDCPAAYPSQAILDARVQYLKSIGWAGFHQS